MFQSCVDLQIPNPTALCPTGFHGGEALPSIPLDKPQASPNRLLPAFNSLVPSHPLARNPAGHREPRQFGPASEGRQKTAGARRSLEPLRDS